MFSSNKRFAVTGDILSTRNRDIRSQGVPLAASGSPRSQETATTLPFLYDSMGGMRNSLRMTVSGPLAFNYTLTGIVPEHEELLRRYYRDIYLYDTTSGSAVDIISTFPFSEYTLTGADHQILEKYSESIHRLDLRSALPEVSTGYLVDAMFIGTLVFNPNTKVFTDIMLHNPDDCKVQPIPFYSFDPRITVINNEQTRRFVEQDSEYARQIKDVFSQDFLNSLRSAAYALNPLTTLYVPRRGLPSRPPTSYLKRVLPIYLLEKQLYRGTLVEATKRQRSLFHITAGDDTWEPTPEELESIVGMFQQAELDPLGAIIATRNSVQGNEMRQGGDFWKWTDVADGLVAYKLRALGISEAFLSSDATYSNSETALSVFLENLDAYRAFLTYKIFYSRIFPIIAYTNDFYRDKSKAPAQKTKLSMMYNISNLDNLIIPKIVWHKKLEAKREEDQMSTLDQLSNHGVPVPLRMWAAAAKIDWDTLVYELEQDKKTRAVLEPYLNAMKRGEGSGEEGGEEASIKLKTLASLLRRKTQRVPLLARLFDDESYEVHGTTRTGKKKWIYNKNEANRKINANLVKASRKLDDPNYRRSIKERVVSKFGKVPNLIIPGKK